VPVAAASQSQDIVDLDSGDQIIVILKPLVTRTVNPADVMAAISRAALVSDDCHQLVMTRI
jgi:hypothetical protein